ncbi:MAG: PadR family transcriptional regulator [Actinomycetota bacterium]|nr:PadR family transcriptional regulator [Actinomycetota bacterium]
MTDDRRQQWLRGVLDLCILGTLLEQERHGYAIASRLAEAGLGDVKGGTLYPVLARMQAAGHVTARWEPGVQGPGRKYYATTAEGRAVLREHGAAWAAFVRTTQDLIDAGGSR